jgi:hypothetical protein
VPSMRSRSRAASPRQPYQVKLIETRYKVELFHGTSRGARLTAT